MFYGIFILLSMILITTLNAIFNVFSLSFGSIVLIVFLSTLAVIGIDLITATIVRWLTPKKWFDPDKRKSRVSKWELSFYKKIRVKKWKDKVLELGFLTKFSKNKLSDPNSKEYIHRFLLESYYGIAVHIFCILTGFLVIFIYPLYFALYFGLPIALVNAFLNLLPIFVLRYNLPKLASIYKYKKGK